MSGKKKKLDFTVRPSVAKEDLPADAERWVRGEQPPEKTAEKRAGEGPQKRLTLNLPSDLHTAFKIHCAREGETIQDKVRDMIEREVAPAAPPPERPADDH